MYFGWKILAQSFDMNFTFLKRTEKKIIEIEKSLAVKLNWMTDNCENEKSTPEVYPSKCNLKLISFFVYTGIKFMS